VRTQDIEIGRYYRLRDSPDYGYVKVLEIVRPVKKSSFAFKMRTLEERSIKGVVVKCEHTIHKNDSFGFIRYFRPTDLVKEATNGTSQKE
jgi:hypothetical protein